MRRTDEVTAKQFTAAKRRVTKLLNAIADLNRGDLEWVLGFDRMTPFVGKMLEQQLSATLVFGEGELITWQKHKRGEKELGGRRFSQFRPMLSESSI